MNNEDKDIKKLLLTYVEKLEQKTLTVEEKMNLIEFYVHDPTIMPEKKKDELSDSQMYQNLLIGRIMSSI